MSDMIDPEDLEDVIRDLLDEIPTEPVSVEWLQEQVKAIRARLAEEEGERIGKERPVEPAPISGPVPRDTSELALDLVSEEKQQKEERRRAVRIALEQEERGKGGSKLLGQIVATKIDHAKVSAQVLDASPELRRLMTREATVERTRPEPTPTPEVSESGPAFQLDTDAPVLGGATEDLEEALSEVDPGVKAQDGGEDAAQVSSLGLALDIEGVGLTAESGESPAIDAVEQPHHPVAEQGIDAGALPSPGPVGGRPEVGEGLALESDSDRGDMQPGPRADAVPSAFEHAGSRSDSGVGEGGAEFSFDGFSLDVSDRGMSLDMPDIGEAPSSEAHSIQSAGLPGFGGEPGLQLGSMDSLSEAEVTHEPPLGSVEEALEGVETPTAAQSRSKQTSVVASGVAPGDDDVDLGDISVDETGMGPTPLLDLPLIHPHRYQTRVRIGAGAQGIVAEVRDRYLARQVALKVLRKELADNAQAIHRFWREAQITGQLAHSGIVPIYDIGVLSDNSPYYTMRRIRGQTLRMILRRLRRIEGGEDPEEVRGGFDAEPETYAWDREHLPIEDAVADAHPADDGAGSDVGEARTDGDAADGVDPREVSFERIFTRRRLIEILVSAAHTLGYAHDRGVIHRDVKPGNLMVGPYGEVLVLDWGIARVLGKASPHIEEGPVVLDSEDPVRSRYGIVKGTPAYMSPEQARGDIGMQGPWTDVYALGLILYEILAGKPARGGVGGDAAMKMAREAVIPPLAELQSARAVRDPVPAELVEICAKCLEEDPLSRYRDAETLARVLEAYATGERRREAAERRATEAEQKVSILGEIDDDISLLQEEVELLRKSIHPWAPVNRKRRLWAKEDKLRAAQQKRDDTLAQAQELFTQALGDDPDNRRARRGLCKLYYEQLLEAERWGRTRESRRLESELKRLDDGLLATALRGYGALDLTSDPAGAGVWTFDLRQRDRQLVPAEGRYQGTTPLTTHIPMGKYLVELRWKTGDSEQIVKYPVRIRRQEKWSGHVRLPEQIPEGFVFVPGSHFVFGGDREAPGSGDREEVWVDDFLIAVFPVTCAQYLEYLQDTFRKNSKEAAKRVPRNPGPKGGEPLWPLEPGRGYRIPGVDAHGGRWTPEMPVRCVSREDAVMYCLWLSSKRKMAIRLPTEQEWEKAGRGVDGRSFPWGNEFDPAFCNMKDSQPGAPELAPVGSFPVDCSPYGVRDMAGGVIEWCAGPFNKDGMLGVQKGGFWLASEPNCRLARRFGVFPTEPEKFCGFRVAVSID